MAKDEITINTTDSEKTINTTDSEKTINTTDTKETIERIETKEFIERTDTKKTIEKTDIDSDKTTKTKMLQIQSERKLEFMERDRAKKRFGFVDMSETGAGSKFGML